MYLIPTIQEFSLPLSNFHFLIKSRHIGNTEESFPLNQGFHEFFGANANHFGPHDNVSAPNVEVYRDYKMVGRYFEREFDINLQTGESNLTRFWTNVSSIILLNDCRKLFNCGAGKLVLKALF